jgi:glycosyltransferase involved in cell wall biosynthesis
MNIVFVNAGRHFGGVKAWTLEAAVQLQKRGWGVTILGRPGPFIERGVALGLDARETSFGSDFHPLTIFRMYRLFKGLHTDVLMVNVGKDIRTAGIAARLAGIPIVHRLGLAGDLKDSPKVCLTHKLLKPEVLVPSRAVKDGLLARHAFYSPAEITVVHTGKVPAQEVPESVHTPRRLAVTSQLRPAKGHERLLEALGMLQNKGYAFHLDIAGTGDTAEELKAQALSLGIAEMLSFHGYVDDVRPILDGADFFVLPSYSEGLPNALLEAMARGLVPLAADVGGTAEAWPPVLNENEGTKGFLFPADAEPEHIAGELEKALGLSEADLLSLKKAVHSHAAEHFNLDKQASLLDAWLRGVAGGKA